MGLNEGFSETFVFWLQGDVFKVVINFTKEMYTVYAPNGRILVRKEKMSRRKLEEVRKEVKEYMDNKKSVAIDFSRRLSK